MTEFDFWQRWAIDLSDAAFANAWAALGILTAAGRGRAGRVQTTLSDALERSRQNDNLIPWAFPGVPRDASASRRLPRSAFRSLIARTSPEELASAWTQVISPSAARFRITVAPLEEPVLPWFRLLREAQPAPASIFFDVNSPNAEREVAWPLRLAFLPGNGAQSLIERVRRDWPSNEHTRQVRLDREHANCDLLVHVGTPRSLLKELLELNVTVKANAVFVYGPDGSSDWGDVATYLASILWEVRGSGYILMPDNIQDDKLASILNLMVAELSHAKPIDLALAISTAEDYADAGNARVDAIGGFTPSLTAFRLPQLAKSYTRRMRVMPKGTEVDLSALGGPAEWLTRGVRGGGHTGGSPLPSAPEADQHVAARSVSIDVRKLEFEHESEGASVLASVSTAIESARVPPKAEASRAARFLQQRSFVRRGREYMAASKGFVAGEPALIRVRIGPLEEEWNAHPAEFPVEQLPQYLERWTLTVWLTEPDHLPQPLRSKIRLPRDGPSTECEFRFRPRDHRRFQGRITVLHRGRVIQTAVLRAAVSASWEVAPEDGTPSLEDCIAVRRRLGDLGHRRQFDLAFVINHDDTGRGMATGLSARHAWIADLEQSRRIAKDINARLSPVAKSVADYSDGLNGERGRALLIQLAQHGAWLYLYLVKQQINALGNRAEIAKEPYLQIVSTRTDAVIPFEFIYEYAAPADDAELCDHWRKALQDGECRKECDRKSDRKVCPMGFWGLQKVIERHALIPSLAKEGYELYLQNEPGRASDTLSLGGVAVIGASTRVSEEAVKSVMAALCERFATEPQRARDWESWGNLVRDHHPNLLIALPHTDGNGANVSLEVGGKSIKAIQVLEQYVRSDGTDAKPLVALLGCDTAGSADDYGYPVVVFRGHGAAIVIATIATVFGEHAADVAKRLVKGMLPSGDAAPQRLGETLRALKREALQDNLLMPLCLVAYGDADWKLSY